MENTNTKYTHLEDKDGRTDEEGDKPDNKIDGSNLAMVIVMSMMMIMVMMVMMVMVMIMIMLTVMMIYGFVSHN